MIFLVFIGFLLLLQLNISHHFFVVDFYSFQHSIFLKEIWQKQRVTEAGKHVEVFNQKKI
jgi:hypothetical protein